MKQKSAKKKSFLLIAASWLLARLWWGLEISGLTIIRVKPRAVVNRMTRDHRNLPACKWILERNHLYCLGVDESEHEIFVLKTPSIDSN